MKKIIIGVLIALITLPFINCKKNCGYSDRCNLIPNPGICQAAIAKYYYDKEEKKCNQFTWGGCGGVVPFETLQDCENACGCNK
jgi:hypothetical protein